MRWLKVLGILGKLQFLYDTLFFQLCQQRDTSRLYTPNRLIL